MAVVEAACSWDDAGSIKEGCTDTLLLLEAAAVVCLVEAVLHLRAPLILPFRTRPTSLSRPGKYLLS